MAKVLRGKSSRAAMEHLRFDVTKTGRLMYKLIFSAVSNAKNNYNLKEENLRIKALTVNEGPSFKRYWFRGRGQADRLVKRSSHFAVVLEEINPTLVKKPVVAKTAEVKDVETSEEETKSTTPRPQGPGMHDNKIAKQGGAKKIMTTRTTNK